MAKTRKGIHKKAGLPPGTLIHVGKKRADNVKITVIDYDEKNYNEKQFAKMEECFPFKDSPTVTWINVDGLHEVGMIEKLGAHYNLHSLILEDILNTNQRPKIEEQDEYLFFTFKMFLFDEVKDEITSEQVSMVLGKNIVISFQEKEGDTFDSLRERLRTGTAKARTRGADYLAYRLVDSIVDHYFAIMNIITEKLEDLEEKVLEDPAPSSLHQLQAIKRDLILLRKSVFPLREAIGRLEKDESKLIKAQTRKYLRDLYDHTVQISESIDSNRDITAGIKDIYLSSLSNKMNVVMKVLTIIATIFIPLTFIAGIYGMNFEYMPELHWKWGYPAVWVVMIFLGVVMLIYFRRKKWL